MALTLDGLMCISLLEISPSGNQECKHVQAETTDSYILLYISSVLIHYKGL